MCLNLLAVVACRVIKLSGGDHNVEDVGYVGLVFARRFAGQWPTTRWAKWCWCDRSDCHIQFHVRCLSITLADDESDGFLLSGLQTQRERHTMSASCNNDGQEDKKITFIETRMSTAVITTTGATQPPYTIVTLTDSKSRCNGGGRPWDQFGTHAQDTICNEIGVDECGAFRGIAMFQVEVHQILRIWNQEWTRALDQIDALVKPKVCVACASLNGEAPTAATH